MKTIAMFSLALACAISPIAAAQSVQVQRPVPYAADNDISDNIKKECKIGEEMADALKENAGNVEFTAAAIDPAAPGRVLQLEITDAVSMGNAWLGHQKFSKVKGTLYQDGKKVASFKGRRNSMGGAFAGYKGSCSVLGRTAEALGEDIAGWLKNPVDGANLGD